MERRKRRCGNLGAVGLLLIGWFLLVTAPTHAQSGTCTRPLDVMLLFDVTGSMGKQLSQAQAQIDQLITSVQADIPDSRFGFGSFADYPTATYPDDTPWKLNQALTADARLVRRRIASVQLQAGGDNPESYARALLEASDVAAIGWRTEASRLIILVGDAPTRDPDPGRDGILGTKDDLTLTGVLTQLRANGIFVYPINYSSSSDTNFAQIASTTGGQVFTGGAADGLLEQIRQAVMVGCTTAVPLAESAVVAVVIPTSGTSTSGGAQPTRDPEFSPWLCLLPLLLLPLLLLLFLRRNNHEAIRRAVRPTDPSTAPLSPVPPLTPPTPPDHPALADVTPRHPQYQPALVLGLGLAGRWSLTYLKEALAGQTDTVALLALDLSPQTEEVSPSVAVLTADPVSGSSEVTLDEALGELLWLDRTADNAEALFRRDPTRFPRLAAWLAALDGLDDQATARLRLLYALREVAALLTRQIEALGQRGGRDIYLVADLGEALGAGGLLDLAQAMRQLAHTSKVNVAIHALLVVPTPDSGQVKPGATYASWRALERGQLVFGRSPSDPLAFDFELLGVTSDSLPTDNRLFDTCALLNADRDVATLVSVSADQGLFPLIADVISAELERPASDALDRHRANVGGRVSLAQQRFGQAFYRSAGSFTYNLAPLALLQQASDALLVAVIEQLVRPGALPRIEPLLAEFSQTFGYQLFTTDPERSFSQGTILGLLELPAERDLLSRYANDALPRQVRYMLLTDRPKPSAREAYAILNRRWLGEDGQSGVFGAMLAQRAANADQRFREHLRALLASMLNRADTPGALSEANAYADALARWATALAATLNEHRRTVAEQLDSRKVAEARDQLANGPNWWRRLLGYVTSPEQDQALAALQIHQGQCLEVLAAGTAADAATALAASAGAARDALQALLTELKAEGTAAERRLATAQNRRRAQVFLGRVRHEWGMPHADVLALRDYLDPERALPQAENRRRQIVALRQYLAGQHVADLAAEHAVGPQALQSRIHWTWEPSAATVAPHPVLIINQQQLPLARAAAWRAAATTLNGWVWTLDLAALLAEELEQPTLLARQLVSELLAPAIRYLPTPNDQHEHFTFLIATPPPTHKDWYAQVIEAQQRTGLAHSYHQQLDGSDPYRVHALALVELIAPLQRGALPALDGITDAANRDATGQTRAAVTLNEAFAARFEQQSRLTRQPFHPYLVAALNHGERTALFARALLTGVLGPDPTQSGLQVVVLPPLHGVLANDPSANPAVWVEALRCFTLADAALLDAVAQRVAAKLPDITERQYVTWLEQGVPATLQAAPSQPARDLAVLIQTILDPHFEP